MILVKLFLKYQIYLRNFITFFLQWFFGPAFAQRLQHILSTLFSSQKLCKHFPTLNLFVHCYPIGSTQITTTWIKKSQKRQVQINALLSYFAKLYPTFSSRIMLPRSVQKVKPLPKNCICRIILYMSSKTKQIKKKCSTALYTHGQLP